MNLKHFIHHFDFSKPDFSDVPEGFPQCDLGGLTSGEVGSYTAIVNMWNMAKPKQPESRSRMWQDPKGFQNLGVWQNAALLRILIRKFTLTLPLDRTLNQPLEFRLKAQLDDAARSVKRNIEEGWKRPTTKEYLDFLGFSQASLEEVAGDIRDAHVDGFLRSEPGTNLKGTLGIDLRGDKGPYKGQSKGEPTEPHHPYCKPLTTLNPHALTLEIFTELINKTDWLLRKLVESLEEKQQQEKKFYQVEKARLKGIAKGK